MDSFYILQKPGGVYAVIQGSNLTNLINFKNNRGWLKLENGTPSLFLAVILKRERVPF